MQQLNVTAAFHTDAFNTANTFNTAKRVEQASLQHGQEVPLHRGFQQLEVFTNQEQT